MALIDKPHYRNVYATNSLNPSAPYYVGGPVPTRKDADVVANKKVLYRIRVIPHPNVKQPEHVPFRQYAGRSPRPGLTDSAKEFLAKTAAKRRAERKAFWQGVGLVLGAWTAALAVSWLLHYVFNRSF